MKMDYAVLSHDKLAVCKICTLQTAKSLSISVLSRQSLNRKPH